MQNTLLVIPAIKKNAVIPDQLIKKLNGITLIQRAINTAKKITSNILIITDSEEISLIAERNNIIFYFDRKLILNSENIIEETKHITQNRKEKNIILYRANTPLVNTRIIKEAYQIFLLDTKVIVTSVKIFNTKILKYENNNLSDIKNSYYKELKAFHIFNRSQLSKQYKPFIIDEEYSIEIQNYQDWWVCEKVLQRKKIVFNVIGNNKIGMGHIYHSLALAHEITDHEIIFVCDEHYEIAVEKIASMDYKVISSSNVLQTILELKPNLVINDILNTNEKYIKSLTINNIKVVNFEDLGVGSKYADIVFNELYDTPQLKGNNYLWGYEYLALRDEFNEAKVHDFELKVSDILITFGGTDQNNLTLLALKSVVDISKSNNIKIYIVCGSGYLFKEDLELYLSEHAYKNIELTYASGVISKIMEKTQLAISSNGRTVYELADMNIPSIIVSHHEREATHNFPTLDKGFINLGVIDNDTGIKIKSTFEKLVEDDIYRELFFINIQKYSFRNNKSKVVKKILELL